MQEVFSFSPILPLFFSPIAHSVRKSVSVSKPFVKNTERTAYSLGPGSARPCLAELM